MKRFLSRFAMEGKKWAVHIHTFWSQALFCRNVIRKIYIGAAFENKMFKFLSKKIFIQKLLINESMNQQSQLFEKKENFPKMPSKNKNILPLGTSSLNLFTKSSVKMLSLSSERCNTELFEIFQNFAINLRNSPLSLSAGNRQETAKGMRKKNENTDGFWLIGKLMINPTRG